MGINDNAFYDMYEPTILTIDTDRNIPNDLLDELNKKLILDQTRIVGRFHETAKMIPLRRHPSNKFVLYSSWFMVNTAAESESDWEDEDFGTGIFPIMEKYNFTFGGASALFFVGNKDKVTRLSIGFEHSDGPSTDWKNEPAGPPEKAFDEFKIREKAFNKIKAQFDKMYPLYSSQEEEEDSDDSYDSDDSFTYQQRREYYQRYNNRRASNSRPMSREEAKHILGLTKTSPTVREIQQAYRKKAKENHPDKGGNPETMKQINNAKDTLIPHYKLKLKF